jgi:hypothetical protein
MTRYPLKARRRAGYLTIHRDAVKELMSLPPHLWGTLTRLVALAEITTGELRTSLRSLAETMRLSRNTVSSHLTALQQAGLIKWWEGTNQHDPSRIRIENWAWLIGLDGSAVPTPEPAEPQANTEHRPAVPNPEPPGGPAPYSAEPPGGPADMSLPAETSHLDTRDSFETQETTSGGMSPENRVPAATENLEEVRVAREGDPCPRCGYPVRNKDRLCGRPACEVRSAALTMPPVMRSAVPVAKEKQQAITGAEGELEPSVGEEVGA